MAYLEFASDVFFLQFNLRELLLRVVGFIQFQIIHYLYFCITKEIPLWYLDCLFKEKLK